ncbi:MAG: ATP-binding protein [Bacteroidales bacterium]|nr:ATP-binding protein [Candidatus Colicola equi]
MNESFSITPRIIAHFGEFLIKNENIALVELVKNSYDAYASYCNISFDEENGKIVRITIDDDGQGMSVNTIKNSWLVIGTSNKRDILDNAPRGARLPLGEKGVGRLGVHKLGRYIKLVTRAKDCKEVELTINWDELAKSPTLDSFTVPVQENEEPTLFCGNQTGTRIVIENLKSKWEKRQMREVYRNLMSLGNPFAETSDDFEVSVTSNNPKIFLGMPSIADVISNGGMYYGKCTMEGNAIAEFLYEYKPWSTLTKVRQGRRVTLNELDMSERKLVGRKLVEEDGKEREVDYAIDLSSKTDGGLGIGKVQFDVIIFETDALIFNYVNAEKKSIKDYLKENGGIRVYRDNVRVYDYGERDNDWLGIDIRRVHRVGGNVSNNIVLGAVKINRAESFGLVEKTNREGFIENEAYLGFVDAINYALSLIVRMRNEDKERLSMLYKQNKTIEPVLSSIDDAIAYVEDKVKNVEDKNNIIKCLNRINVQYKEVKETLIKSANAGLNLSVVIHELEKQISALTSFARRGEHDKIQTVAYNLEKIVRGYTAMIRKSSIGIGNLMDVCKIAIDNYEFRFSDHSIKVLFNSDSSDLTAKFARSESISVLTNLLDNSIYWVSKTRDKADRYISVYITSQIEGYVAILVSDNGPGFNIGTDVAVQPFISGKPNNIGMGLGLHIVNEMMHAMNGNLIFYDKNDIELPKEVETVGADKAIIALCFPK